MSVPNPTKQVAATSQASLGDWVAMFTAAAGTTGANELSGSPYGRIVSSPFTTDGQGNANFPQINSPCPAASIEEAGLFSTQAGNFVQPPTGLQVLPAAGGSLTAGTTRFYKLTGFNWAGETTASLEVSFTPSGGNLSGILSWSTLAGISDQSLLSQFFAGFRLYVGTTSGGENVLLSTLPATATTYTDTGAVAGTSAAPPTTNTASTFVGSSELIGGTLTVVGSAASVNLVPGVSNN